MHIVAILLRTYESVICVARDLINMGVHGSGQFVVKPRSQIHEFSPNQTHPGISFDFKLRLNIGTINYFTSFTNATFDKALSQLETKAMY